MQLILETETIDIHTKMSEINVQQPLDDKIVPNGLLDNINSCEISSNGDTKAEKHMKEPVSADAENCVETANEIMEENGVSQDTNGKENIEELNHDNIMEDKIETISKENGSFSEHFKTKDGLETPISSKHVLDAKNTETKIGFQISNVQKHLVEKKEDIPAENLEDSISPQTKSPPLINDLENCEDSKEETPEESQIQKDIWTEKISEKIKESNIANVEKHSHEKKEDMPAENLEDSITPQTKSPPLINNLENCEDSKEETPEESQIEKVISTEQISENIKELHTSDTEINTEIESVTQETVKNTVQIEVKPIEEESEAIDEVSTLQANLIEDNLDNGMQSMEQDSILEMITETGLNENKIKEKETILETDIAHESSNENNRDPPEVVQMEQDPIMESEEFLTETKINENEVAIQKTEVNSDAVAIEENSDKHNVELLGEEPMEQEPSSQTDISLTKTKNDNNKTVVQATETISAAIDVKEKTNNISILSEEEPMKQKSPSQIDCALILSDSDDKKCLLPEKRTDLGNASVKEKSIENQVNIAENQSMELVEESTSLVDVVDSLLPVTDKKVIEGEIKRKETESPEDINRVQVSEIDSREQHPKSPVNEAASSESTFESDETNLAEAVKGDSLEGKDETSVESAEKKKIIEENIVTDTSYDYCKPKSLGGLIVKSPTEINKISLNAEIQEEKITNNTKEPIGQNILPASPVRCEVQDIVTDKDSVVTEKSKVCVVVNDKTPISTLHTDPIDKELSSAEKRIISDPNEDTAFTLNDSDDECQVIKPKDKVKSPSKTEEILDTIIACMEVDRGDKKKVGETAEIDITYKKTTIPDKPEVPTKRLCNLSNTLDILSDDDDEEPETKVKKTDNVHNSQQNSINIDDDDDVMLIDEDPIAGDANTEVATPKATDENENQSVIEEVQKVAEVKVAEAQHNENSKIHETEIPKEKEPEAMDTTEFPAIEKPDISEKPVEKPEILKKVEEKPKPLVPENFLKTFKTNVADMTREDLEDLCLQLIVEGVVDRSNLSEIKTKVKTMSSSMEEWRKKTMMLTKQNRDLQIVLKTVQEEQKKKGDGAIVPLKITRSVGMQVYMYENERGVKRKNPAQTPTNTRNTRNAPNPSPRQQQKPNAQIPVPRLVPATTSNSPAKNTRPNTPQVQNTTVTSNSGVKTSSPMQLPTGVRNSPPVKAVEKRPFSSVQSVTVDLTDDEPPSKQQVTTKNAPQPPVRLVAQNQLLTARAQSTQNNGPRKVYIPINSQNQAIRAGQTIMLKSVPPGQGPRPRNARPMVTIPSNGPIRMPRQTGNQRHPAPLPDVTKQQQPPNWKALPPSPDLKISKVENGIVISWKIEGYQEDSYEEIASYQLYAYQETSSPPSTLLWKKIGDVKALPLPMACTLTQFMAGYKYYFAVRAIDVRSRIGPFSLPGSILLLNK